MSTKAPNPVDKYVGSRVRMRRIMLGMSQEKLGEALGLTFQQVQKYEKGTNRVGASRIQQISEILQVPVSFLFEGGPSGGADADGFGEGSLAGLRFRFPGDVRRPGADPRLHPHHRRQASAQHRRDGRTDRRTRRPRQALRRSSSLRDVRAAIRASSASRSISRIWCSAGHPGMTAVDFLCRQRHADNMPAPIRSTRKTILDGIRRWVEIETPTEAPEQVNRLATLVAEGYRDLPATIERIADVTAAAIIWWRARHGARMRRASWCSAISIPCIRSASSSGCRFASRATAPSAPASTT